MTTRADLEAALYRAITGNRLSAATHTVDNAIKEIGRRFPRPWDIAGVSRETWRRWNLAAGAKNSQRPSKSHQAGLLAVLRRLRLSDAREAKLRASTGIHVHATDNYEDEERDLGTSTFDWTSGQANRLINDIVQAYSVGGVGRAVDEWLKAAPVNGGWAAEWLNPASHGSSQSMDLHSISLMGDPARAGRGARRRR